MTKAMRFYGIAVSSYAGAVSSICPLNSPIPQAFLRATSKPRGFTAAAQLSAAVSCAGFGPPPVAFDAS